MKKFTKVVAISLLVILPGTSALAMKKTKAKGNQSVPTTTVASADVTKITNDTPSAVKVTVETEGRKYSYTLTPKQTFSLEDDKFKTGLVKKFEIDGRDLTEEFKNQRKELKRNEAQISITSKDTFKVR